VSDGSSEWTLRFHSANARRQDVSICFLGKKCSLQKCLSAKEIGSVPEGLR